MQDDQYVYSVPIDLTLPDGSVVKVESSLRGKQDVSLKSYPIQEIFGTIGRVAESLSEIVVKSKASKSTIKFGVELAVESGQLTTLIVKGSAKGNLEITLEWDNSSLKEVSSV